MSKANPIKIYFLDNFDSFTYNLVDELTMLGCELVVYRNNISAEVIFNKMPGSIKSFKTLNYEGSQARINGIDVDVIGIRS